MGDATIPKAKLGREKTDGNKSIEERVLVVRVDPPLPSVLVNSPTERY